MIDGPPGLIFERTTRYHRESTLQVQRVGPAAEQRCFDFLAIQTST